MALYEIDFPVFITSGYETFSHSLTAGELYVANKNVVPSNGTLIYISNPLVTDFKGHDLSATDKRLTHSVDLDGGGVLGDVFRIYNNPVSATYIISLDFGSVGVDKRNGKMLTHRGRVSPLTNYQPEYKLTLKEDNAVLINWASVGESLGFKSYVCVNDSDYTLLETDSTWSTNRIGNNDVLLYNSQVHSPTDNSILIFERPVPYYASAATITADLTNIVNKINDRELIIKTQITYANSYSADYIYYTGKRTRNTIYHTQGTADPEQLDYYTNGISRFLIDPLTSQFIMEDWVDADYNEFSGTQTRPALGVLRTSATEPINLPTSAIVDEIKSNYITVCGLDRVKFGMNKFINLVNYLPQYLRKTEVETFLKFFEDYLNTMYEGIPGIVVSAIDLSVDRDDVPPVSAYNNKSYIFSANEVSAVQEYTSASNVQQVKYISSTGLNNILIPMLSANGEVLENRISILEKINQLTELQDADLVDIDFIQYFAKNLGYNVNVNRNEIGTNIGNLSVYYNDSSTNSCSAIDQNKYLRFIVNNLPTWYKIKTTKNSIKVMLYSFGLIGDLVEYYSNDYKNNWKIDYNGDVSTINNNFYPTPHFAIVIDIDKSYRSISYDWEKREKIIKAIEDLRPVNTVFEKLTAYADRTIDIYLKAQSNLKYYAVIK